MTGLELRAGCGDYPLALVATLMLSPSEAAIFAEKRGGERRFGCSRWPSCVEILMPCKTSQSRVKEMSLEGLLLGLCLALSCKLRLGLQVGLHELV